MKAKDLVALALFGLVLVVVGSFFVSRVGRSGQPRSAEVEVVAPIDATFNEDASKIIKGQHTEIKVTPYSAPPNLTEGFGNNNPFGVR